MNSHSRLIYAIMLYKSRAVAGKPREAVQISICEASGERHTEYESDKKRKLAFSTTALSFDTTSAANPDEYQHYIIRNHKPWATSLPLAV